MTKVEKKKQQTNKQTKTKKAWKRYFFTWLVIYVYLHILHLHRKESTKRSCRLPTDSCNSPGNQFNFNFLHSVSTFALKNFHLSEIKQNATTGNDVQGNVAKGGPEIAKFVN